MEIYAGETYCARDVFVCIFLKEMYLEVLFKFKVWLQGSNWLYINLGFCDGK